MAHPLDRIDELLNEIIEKTKELQRLENPGMFCTHCNEKAWDDEYGIPLCIKHKNEVTDILRRKGVSTQMAGRYKGENNEL